jgi:uncharacterized Zn-finger protein
MFLSSMLFQGERPHACTQCNKAFSTSSALNTHKRIHSGERPHACPICGKTFTASSNLYYHRMTHSKVNNLLTKKEVIQLLIIESNYFRLSHINVTHVTNHTQHQETCGHICHHTLENGRTIATPVIAVSVRK